MPRKSSTQPTEVELMILNVLWDRGPSSVGEIHEALLDQRDRGYSTTLKMVQVMTEKGLLLKDDSQRPQIFTPAMSQTEAQAGMVDDLLQRAFGGAVDKLVMRALETKKISTRELEQIKKLLKQVDRSKS